MESKFLRLTTILSLFIFLNACDFSLLTYGPVEKNSTINWGGEWYGKPNSHLFAVVINYKEIQKPTGIINTFPNGGVPRTLVNEYLIYLCNAKNGETNLLARIKPPEKYGQYIMKISDKWDDNHFFASAKYRPATRFGGVVDNTDWIETLYQFSLNGDYKQIQNIPSSAKEVIRDKWYPPEGKFVRFTTKNNEIHIYTEEQIKHKTKPYAYNSRAERSYYYKAFYFDTEKKELIPALKP